MRLTFLLILISLGSYAQPTFNKVEEIRTLALLEKCEIYRTKNFDSVKFYGEQALALAEQTNFVAGKVRALCQLGILYTRKGDIPRALQLEFSGLQISQDAGLIAEQAFCLHAISKAYYFLNDYATSIIYGRQSLQLYRNTALDTPMLTQSFDNELILGEAFMDNNQLDSALVYLESVDKSKVNHPLKSVIKIFLGDAYFRTGNHTMGLTYLRSIGRTLIMNQDHYSSAWACTILAKCFSQLNQLDSAIYYAKLGLAEAQQVGFKTRELQASQLLAKLYSNNDLKQENYYLNLSSKLNDELFGSKKMFELQKAVAQEQQQRLEVEKKRLAYESNIKQYGLITVLTIILLVAILLYRNNRQKQKANKVLEKTLTNLKSTQSQLIQSEKMASLGELTAGIAHEIQNPLNFVNNFSEVSSELIGEMVVEVDKGNYEEVKAIASDVKQNLEKINHHGKRAADIVKGMLQHSRSSSGAKEPTDINALCDEYLRLSYHGLRAKDKNFNANMKTDFDESIGNINIIPQDIGRVILNLLTNAFYVVNEKKQQNMEGYEPTVSISTKKIGNKVEIKVTDNGNGIPQKVLGKIFQPFFTTKPTGKGTGLGLSLSYDIVKAHGGELKVDTKEGEGTTFIIQLTNV